MHRSRAKLRAIESSHNTRVESRAEEPSAEREIRVMLRDCDSVANDANDARMIVPARRSRETVPIDSRVANPAFPVPFSHTIKLASIIDV